MRHPLGSTDIQGSGRDGKETVLETAGDPWHQEREGLSSSSDAAEAPAERRTESGGGGHHSGVESEGREGTGLCRWQKPRARS